MPMSACRRLAMLCVVEDHETPSTRATGHECGVKVRGVGAGDVVEMVVQRQQGESVTIRLVEGSTPLSPSDWIGYYVRKIAGPVPRGTTVEILLNG